MNFQLYIKEIVFALSSFSQKIVFWNFDPECTFLEEFKSLYYDFSDFGYYTMFLVAESIDFYVFQRLKLESALNSFDYKKNGVKFFDRTLLCPSIGKSAIST